MSPSRLKMLTFPYNFCGFLDDCQHVYCLISEQTDHLNFFKQEETVVFTLNSTTLCTGILHSQYPSTVTYKKTISKEVTSIYVQSWHKILKGGVLDLLDWKILCFLNHTCCTTYDFINTKEICLDIFYSGLLEWVWRSYLE